MNLIGECDHDAERQQEAVEGVPRTKLLPRLDVHEVRETDQWEESNETVVAVCFDEIVTGDGQRVNVMLSERSDESLQIK